MLFKLYTENDVKKVITRIKEEYETAISGLREKETQLTEENRRLRARVLELEGERSGAFAAFQAAEREKSQAREEGEKILENSRRELLLLREKCALMLRNLERKYPDAEDTARLRAFTAELGTDPPEEEETGFNLEEVTSPKKPLDLKKLCLELGLTEDDDGE